MLRVDYNKGVEMFSSKFTYLRNSSLVFYRRSVTPISQSNIRLMKGSPIQSHCLEITQRFTSFENKTINPLPIYSNGSAKKLMTYEQFKEKNVITLEQFKKIEEVTKLIKEGGKEMESAYDDYCHFAYKRYLHMQSPPQKKPLA